MILIKLLLTVAQRQEKVCRKHALTFASGLTTVGFMTIN
jgi:hypothetical protein